MNQHKNICKNLVNFKVVSCKALLLNPDIGDENINTLTTLPLITP